MRRSSATSSTTSPRREPMYVQCCGASDGSPTLTARAGVYQIKDAMGFALDNAEFATEIAKALRDSLTQSGTAAPKKVRRRR